MASTRPSSFAARQSFLTRFHRTGYPDFGDTDIAAIRKGVEAAIGLNELYEVEAATVEFGEGVSAGGWPPR